jgi:hypothetical protein
MRAFNQSYSTISMIPLQTKTRALETMDRVDEEAGTFERLSPSFAPPMQVFLAVLETHPIHPFVFTGTLTPLQQSKTEDDSAPVGYWKDGLFECCRFGFFHPSLWNATCCPQILLAQISTRLRLNWLGDAYSGDWKRTYRIVLGIVIGYWALCILFAPKPPEIVAVNGVVRVVSDADEPQWKQRLYDLMTVTFGLYTLVYLTKV